MTEAELLERVLAEADRRGIYVLHIPDSRRVMGVAGFPDLLLAGPCGILFRELKSLHGPVSPAQRRWLAALRASGQDARVWRPGDWPDEICRQLVAIGP